ncbi:hypothetical protein F4677DRAFT_419298 [Hypoxylon crocopeplum]|nr:hypothetical protein F4677DRAFT_419298 [Hypoxylon crocopeplum]
MKCMNSTFQDCKYKTLGVLIIDCNSVHSIHLYSFRVVIAMAPHRKEPSPTEADSGSDVELNIDVQFKPSASIPQAMESIDKWKAKRSEIQKNIDEDFTNQLTVLKNKIKAHYHTETQNMSDHNKEQVERLIAALEKRMDCEAEISKQIDSLRDDCAHIAMLIDAIYAAREDTAAQTAKAAAPELRKN